MQLDMRNHVRFGPKVVHLLVNDGKDRHRWRYLSDAMTVGVAEEHGAEHHR